METTITNNETNLEKLSISDKLVSLLTEPSKLFSNISNFGVKTTDWLIPVIVMTLLAMTLQIVIIKNPALKQQIVNEQIEGMKEILNQMVISGKLTQEQADEQLEANYDRLDEQTSGGLISSLIGILIFSFIYFFIISGFYIFIMKYLLKGKGNYQDGLAAYGLPLYIIGLQLIATIILVLLFGNIKSGPDVAKILGYNTKEFVGYILSFLDPLKIWFYTVVGIAFAKLYKSKNSLKFIIASLSIWIIFGLSIFGLSEVFPLLKFIIR